MGSVGGVSLSDSLDYADTDAYTVLSYASINKVNNEKVQAIADDIEKNGWTGLPILYSEMYGQLLTGSHRQVALQELDDRGFDIDTLGNVAVNVDDLIEKWSAKTGKGFDEIRFDSIGEVFKGTWLEKYKKYIEEW